MRFLRTNTAIRITVGPFFDKTDGITPEVAITVTSCKLTLMVDDANVPTLVLDAAPTASGGNNDMVHVTGDDAGFYDLELTAANLNFLGRAMLAITDAATHCPVFHEFMILPAMIYDALVLGTDDLDTNTKKWNDLTTVALPLVPAVAGRTLVVDAAGLADANTVKLGPTGAGTAQTARDIGTSVLLSSGTGTGQIKIASGYVAITWADIAAPTTTVALTGTTVKTATDVETDTQDIQSRLPAALSGGNIKADVLALSGDTTAADNSEAFFDGTGYAGTNNIIPTVTNLTTVANIWTGALTEAYAADGAAFTPAQALYMLWGALSEFSIAGTTITCKKLDGTTSMTFTLDSASMPTSRTRAS